MLVEKSSQNICKGFTNMMKMLITDVACELWINYERGWRGENLQCFLSIFKRLGGN